jgi:hypothetical protein
MIDVCVKCDKPIGDHDQRYEDVNCWGGSTGEFWHEECARATWEDQEVLLIS